MLYDFRCQGCGKKEERWVTSDTTTVRCECGSDQVRCLGGHAVLDPLSGDFPGATLRWARHHEQAAKAKQ